MVSDGSFRSAIEPASDDELAVDFLGRAVAKNGTMVEFSTDRSFTKIPQQWTTPRPINRVDAIRSRRKG